MNHTKEPWVVGHGYEQSKPGIYIAASRGIGTVVCSTDKELREQDAERIVTCVNACAGLHNPEENIGALVVATESLIAEAEIHQVCECRDAPFSENEPFVCARHEAIEALTPFREKK